MDASAHAPFDYGLWTLVVVNSLIFIVFAFSFVRPKTGRDWRSLGLFSAFIVALFTEMYGFPLTVYLLSGWISSRFGGAEAFSHGAGHLWSTLLGLQGDPHLNPIHVASNVFILAGLLLLVAAWRLLHRSQKEGNPAETGPYAVIRHPQYAAFILVMFGFLLQWPTLPTLVLFPILVAIYVGLARREERETLERFGDPYARYLERTPAFIPTLRPRPSCDGWDPVDRKGVSR